jgi:1-acyl-sn-glycerol-3-phosphate acyltransferase
LKPHHPPQTHCNENKKRLAEIKRQARNDSFSLNSVCFIRVLNDHSHNSTIVPMRSHFHLFAYGTGKLLVRLLLARVTRVHVIRSENANRPGGFLLAANHISHFDPFIISSVIGRKIDWMTMAEFFRLPAVGFLLRAVDTFPADRDRANRKTIRTAIERLKEGRIVGLFPEGGIRDGARSLLEGAPLRPGASTLAHLAGIPILPCIILGSDRLYSAKSWLPASGGRTPIWIAFGNPISHFPGLEKSEARARIEFELAAAFKSLYAELQQTFHLTSDDLPHPPRERMKRCRASGRHGKLAVPGNVNGSGRPTIHHDKLHRIAASGMDAVLCASINFLHIRHRLNGHSRAEMERYVEECERITAQQYYAPPHNDNLAKTLENGRTTIKWRSPIETKFPANNVACADFFPSKHGGSAPTVFILHALMSTSPVGYRRCADHFNELGWNACFIQLPYHYSRVPHGYWNGELAITCDLIRNAEGLRQGVMELRQLMSALREHGTGEFGVLATSYGGWIGALLAMVERDLRFVALMAPIVNIDHAIWESSAARLIRRELRRTNIEASLVARHFHLSSPTHNMPLCDPARVLFVAGEFDSIAPLEQLETIQQKWRGSELLRVRQGHFGYRMLGATIARLKARGDL